MLNHLFAWLFSFHDFSISSKTNISKFQFNQESGGRRITLWMFYLQIIIERWDALLALFLHGYVMYKKSLPEENIIHVLIIEWTHSSWYKNKCFVLSWYHNLSRTAITIRYVCFFKILYYRFCKVTMTTNKVQNLWNMRTKVSNETCSSGRLPYESGQVKNVPNNSKTFNTGVFWTPVEKIWISGRTKN